jgi:hypothetical protein
VVNDKSVLGEISQDGIGSKNVYTEFPQTFHHFTPDDPVVAPQMPLPEKYRQHRPGSSSCSPYFTFTSRSIINST